MRVNSVARFPPDMSAESRVSFSCWTGGDKLSSWTSDLPAFDVTLQDDHYRLCPGGGSRQGRCRAMQRSQIVMTKASTAGSVGFPPQEQDSHITYRDWSSHPCQAGLLAFPLGHCDPDPQRPPSPGSPPHQGPLPPIWWAGCCHPQSGSGGTSEAVASAWCCCDHSDAPTVPCRKYQPCPEVS